MSAMTNEGMSRRRLLEMAGTAAAAAAVAGLARPAEAAQQTMTLNANLTGPLPPRFVIPMVPEIRLGQFTAQGTSDLLGAVQFTEANTLHIGIDGKSVAVTDGIGVLAGSGGDALFINYSGLPIAGTHNADFGFTVCGGSGRFVGASGSGIIHCETAADMKTFSRVIQGMVVLPASA